MTEERERREWKAHVPTRDGMHIAIFRSIERSQCLRVRTAYAKAVRRLKRAAKQAKVRLKDDMRRAARTDDAARQWLANKGIK